MLTHLHHFGLKDRLALSDPETEYPKREPLSFSRADMEEIKGLIVEYLDLTVSTKDCVRQNSA